MVFMAHQRTTPPVETRVDDIAAIYSDEECVQRLAALVEHQDNKTLAETARLISRLAVTIE
jgi:hypothetical protein